jgi:hypothetical protein
MEIWHFFPRNWEILVEFTPGENKIHFLGVKGIKIKIVEINQQFVGRMNQ